MSDIGVLPAHLSFSSVDTLLQCGEKFRLQRVLKAPQVPAWYFAGGSAVHAATEYLDRHMWETGELLNDLQIEMKTQHFMNLEIVVNEAIEPDRSKWAMGGRANAKEGEEWWQVQAPKMVIAWRKWMWEDESQTLAIWELPNGQPAIELEVMTLFGGVPVKMAIDRVLEDVNTGELIVVDIKAGSREPASSFQTAQYGEAVRRTIGVEARWGAYWMARKGTLTQPKDLRPLIGLLDDRFAKARVMVDNEVFLAVPGMFCGSCSVKEYCSAMGGSDKALTSVRMGV